MTPPDPALLSLNTITTKRWTLAEAIAGCVRHGIGGITVWRDRLQEMGVAAAAKSLRDNGLAVTGLCRGGMFPAADAAGRRASIEDNYRAIDEAKAIGARCLILVVGGMPPGSKDLGGAREQVKDGIATILGRAREANMPLAIEPLHPMQAADRACINTLGQALDLCDWLVPTTDLAFDRGMMGDGVIDLRRIRGLMENAGYRGYNEVEIFSQRDWWQRDPDEVLQVMKQRYADC